MNEFNRLKWVSWLACAVPCLGCGEPAKESVSGGGGAGGGGASIVVTAGSAGSATSGSAGSVGTSGSAGSGGGAAIEAGVGLGDGSAGDSAATAAACTPAKPHAAGDSTETFDFGGVTRDYVVHIPKGYDGAKRVPLVIDLHGYTSWATEQATRTKWGAKADAEGFIVVDPDGVDKSWNATVCCGTAQSSKIDDVAFMRAVVARVSGALCVDPKRVFLSGHSNGAMMTFVLGCQAADFFAAIAPVAGVTPVAATCHPSRPVPVAMIRARQDGAVPYDGKGTGAARFQSAQEDFDTWKAIDQCASSPS